ncbi:hypothetical protein BC834DRAFT_9244 [Gloeopeniophorella convolvens]|nr:hypothetical protein BC834DRAFT_9244 [Gloeopeniophorella convolvens]
MLARRVLEVTDLGASGSHLTAQRCLRYAHSSSKHVASAPQSRKQASPHALRKAWSPSSTNPVSKASSSTPRQTLRASSETDKLLDVLSCLPADIPKKIQYFRTSTSRTDLLTIFEAWRSLEKDNLLHLLSPSDLEHCSRLVISACPTLSHSEWTGPRREAAEELALGLAGRLSTSALSTCFTSLVTINDPQGILRLHDRFMAQMDHRHVFDDEEWSDSDALHQDFSEVPSVHGADRVDKEFTYFAMVAHAMHDDFQSAIRTGIDTKWSIPLHSAGTFLDTLAPSPSFRQKFTTFVSHANAASLLCHTSFLSNHIRNLISTPATKSLQGLYKTVVEGLSDEYSWATIESSAPSGRPVIITEATWAAFLSAFLEAGRLDSAEAVWDDMVRYGHKPGPNIWTVLIKGVGTLKGADNALALWRSMEQASVTPDNHSYQAIIQILSKERRYQEAVRLFDDFKSTPRHSRPDGELPYSAMINAHLANSCEADAVNLLEEMIAGGPHPTTHTFNTFLTYYYNKKDTKSLSAMLKKMTANGLTGDVATFSILLCTLLRILDRGTAIKQTLAVMAQHNVKPNVATYTAIVTSLVREKDKNALDAALDLLRTMEESGDPAVVPNVVTYTAVLNGLHPWIGKDDLLVQDYTDRIVQRMQARRVKFNKVTYNLLFKTCLGNPSPDGVQKALQLYRQMLREKVPLTGDTWHILLRGLAKRNEFVVAYEVLRDMRRSGVRMTDWLENTAEEVARGYTGYMTSRARSAAGR